MIPGFTTTVATLRSRGCPKPKKQMFEKLIQLITTHASYGPAMADAVKAQLPLILNYHTHGPDQDYCVSISAKEHDPLQFFEPKKTSLQELVHIRGFGPGENDCIPLCTKLGRELIEHFGLENPPEIYLNGDPFPESKWEADGPHG